MLSFGPFRRAATIAARPSGFSAGPCAPFQDASKAASWLGGTLTVPQSSPASFTNVKFYQATGGLFSFQVELHHGIISGSGPLTCPDCGAEMRILAFIEEDRVIGEEFSGIWAYSPTPRAVRRSRSPSTRRSTTTCPPWKRKTLSTSPSERPKSLRRPPVLASWRPARPPGSPKRARTSERSPKRR